MKLKIFLFIFLLLVLAAFPKHVFALACIDPCRFDSDCDFGQYCYVPVPPECAVCKDIKQAPTVPTPVNPSSNNSSTSYSYSNPSPTALRPNPFDLVPEETQKQFSTSKDQMTIGVAESPEFNLPIDAITSNFWRFITPFLSPGQGGLGGFSSGTGTGTSGTPIGPITSTCANTDGIFVYQSDPSWSNVKSPNHPEYDHCTIGLCGCGSASTTMILNSFGAGTDVVSVWNHQHEIGGYVYQLDPETNHYYCMTVHAGPSQIFAESGLSSAYIGTGSDADWQEVETFLNNCGLIYATGLAYWPGRDPGGHVIVISGIIKDSDGKVVSIKTLDPGTSGGNGLIRTLGAGTGDYAYEVKHLWAITQ